MKSSSPIEDAGTPVEAPRDAGGLRLSRRIREIAASRTVGYTTLIAKLRAEGREIIDMSVGEPDDDTPPAVVAATKKALDEGQTRYGPVAGIPELRQMLARQFAGYDAANIIIANGAKQALYSIFQVLCNPGDEVIVPRPYYASFAAQINLAGGRPVFVDTVDHQLDPDRIGRAITPQTRVIVINSPNNPTGAVYSRHSLLEIARLAAAHDLFVVADEAYEKFIYDGLEPESFFNLAVDRAKTVTIRSFSKSAAMTGFRIGYVAAPGEIIAAINKFQGHVTGNVCTFAQYGALAALALPDDYLQKKVAALQKKRDIAYACLARVFDCVRPQGAFYIFPDVSKHLNGQTAAEFAAHILEMTGVATVPGEAFGTANHLRISYAVKEENLINGLEKIIHIL